MNLNPLSWVIPLPYRILALVVLVAAAAGGGARVAYLFEHNARTAEVQTIRTAEATERARVVTVAARLQHIQDGLSTVHAVAEASAQERITTRTITRVQEVPRYVTQTVEHRIGCIPWGVVRVLDAAATHRDPADLVPAAGQPDDACAPIAPAAFTAGLVGNYGVADQNAEQLDALISDVRARTSAAQAAPPPDPATPGHP